jgi:DNA processing protein
VSERLVLAGLWAIPGVGPKTIARVRREFHNLEQLAERPLGGWALDLLPTAARSALKADWRIAAIGERMLERAKQRGMSVAFEDDPAYPKKLRGYIEAPPLLFHWGPGDDVAPRRRVGMVGTRHPEFKIKNVLEPLVRATAKAGIGVVSGAAMGVDQLCHLYSAAEAGETWGFLGSSLDQIDPNPLSIWRQVQRYGATFFSEYPPGVRAQPKTFPRRNRLIAACSDAVLIVRGGLLSGTRFTIGYARRLKRPLLAMPGDLDNQTAALPNLLLRKGWATPCLSEHDVLRAVGASGASSHKPAAHTRASPSEEELSPTARELLPQLPRRRMNFEDLQMSTKLESARLLSALCELELYGFAVQYPGREFERV